MTILSSFSKPNLRRDKESRRRLHDSKSNYRDDDNYLKSNTKISAVTIQSSDMNDQMDSQGNLDSTKNLIQRRSKKDRKARI